MTNAHIIGFPVGLTPGLTRGEIQKMQGDCSEIFSVRQGKFATLFQDFKTMEGDFARLNSTADWAEFKQN